MDYGTLSGLYRRYLGRDPEPGAESWLQYDDGTIESGIANSEEANNFRNQSSQPQQQQPQQQAPSGLDDNAIRQLYQQYLGRDADQGGLDTWRGQSYDQVLNGIVNSGEYAQRIMGQQTPAMNSGAGRNPVTQINPINDPNNYDYPPPRLVDTGDGQVYVQDPPTPKAGADFGTGGVNWILDPTNLAKNAVSWGDWYGMGKYVYADGSTALANPSSPNTAASVTPPYSAYEDPANKRLGYRNYAYSGTSVPELVTINGVQVQVQSPELLLNPQGKVFTDPNKGNRTYTIQDVSPQPKDSQTFQVFDTVIKIGAAIMASVAFAPVGMAILESATGLTAAELTTAYGATAVNSVAAGLSGATASSVNTALQGGDINKILESAAKAAISAGAGSAVAGSLPGDLSSSAAGATTGAAKGAVTAILGGKDVLTGAAKGAIPGAVGGGVMDVSNIDFSGEPDFAPDDQLFDPATGQPLSAADVAKLNPDLYPGGMLPKEGQVTQYNPDGSVKYVDTASTGEKLAASTGSTLAGGFLVPYLFPSSKSSSGGITTSGSSPSPVKTGPGQGPGTSPSLSSKNISNTPSLSSGGLPITGSSYFGPNTSALGQALRTGSGALGGTSADAGAGGEDTSKETGGTPQNVWNTASLRYKDETGSY
jgi:hypothetical protein